MTFLKEIAAIVGDSKEKPVTQFGEWSLFPSESYLVTL